jgi:precorrin-4 C11-methyltransferase
MVRAIVHFIGAGPGDPKLLTLKAQRLIAQADVIIYAGSLVNVGVLAHARPDAEIHNSNGMKLGEQVALMHAAVEKGQTVARLHTGDPSLYGAIAEQMRELDKAGISYDVVPGVSSASAAAAALGLELTVPEETQTVIFTRLAGRTPVPDTEALRLLAAHRSSLVIFLSVGMIERVVDELYAAGYAAEMPVAVVYRASWPDELIVRSTLADVAAQVQAAEITHQALIIVSPALRCDAKQTAHASHLYGAALDTPERQDTVAIITLTRDGTETGRRLHAVLPGSVFCAPARFVEPGTDEQPGIVPYTASVRQALQSAFEEYSALVCIMASGIVVRELAPLLRSKHTDPAVVVLDEHGQYAVSLLSGHEGGANRLAHQVAELLGGTAVLTTASDVLGLPSVDLLGQKEGWVLWRSEHLTAVSAALVNGETVGAVQEAGDESWWPQPTPANLIRYPTLAALQEAAPLAALLITFRRVPEEFLETVPCTVIYHPPCLAVGVGCNRGTLAEEILDAIDQTLAEAGLAAQSVCCVATIEDKSNEAGLMEACQLQGWPLKAFSRQEIAAVKDIPNPSVWAQRVLGVPGVAEPAALLAADSGELLVEKRKFPNVTVAVAGIAERRSVR